jgi:hypothetical protein
MRRLVLALIGTMALTTAADASCRQDRATYGDSQSAFELRFLPSDSEASASTHRFMVSIPSSALTLQGYVMGSEPVSRSNGMIFNNCPEGDVTGADLVACTVWQGVIYGNVSGKLSLLPDASAEAAPEILLPDLGPALASSPFWQQGKAPVAPWDVLTLKGCG